MVCPVCGYKEQKADKARSLAQHRRYFGLLKAVFAHWPETHERQFADEHELRKWCEMKAGWREVAATIPMVGMQRERALMLVEAAIRAAGSYAIPVLHKGDMVIFRPKSISFSRMPHHEFNDLCDRVERVIREETGLDPEQVLREHEHAA
jgi:hypothetical protein